MSGALIQPTHLFGQTPLPKKWLEEDAWARFHYWAADHNIKLYLKRELRRKDVKADVQPVDWPCYLPSGHLHNKEEFNSRPVEVFNVWGYSNPVRPSLHAAIFEGMNTHSLGIISDFEHYDGYFTSGGAGRTWMSVFSPYYVRHPLSELMRFQENSKFTVSLPGCGVKCFRHAEAPVSSIMALPRDKMAWSYDWVHGENCIRLEPGNEFESLERATYRPDLFDIYMQSLATIDKYRGERYANEYVLPLIKAAL